MKTTMSSFAVVVLGVGLCGTAISQQVPSFIVTTVAGRPQPATAAPGTSLMIPVYSSYNPIATDSSGNVYIASGVLNTVFKLDPNGTVTRIAGNGGQGYSGDGGPALRASLYAPVALAVDGSGNLFIADYENNRVRKVDASGTITTVAGNGIHNHTGDGGPATSASLSSPGRVAVDGSGNLYIADADRIRKVAPASGNITTLAGTGTAGYSGDGGPATGAQLKTPEGLAVDASGSLYIADNGNKRRKLTPDGNITTMVR